jgi:hypothetical protein
MGETSVRAGEMRVCFVGQQKACLDVILKIWVERRVYFIDNTEMYYATTRFQSEPNRQDQVIAK